MASENALAELAERLNTDLNVVKVISAELGGERGSSCWHLYNDIRKAQRIVAELAKYGNVTPPFLNMKSVFENCHAIAEEGTTNG